MEDNMRKIIEEVRELISQGKFAECEAIISTAMFQYPHDPAPHNLMGIMLEAKHYHSDAMKHFRAALALDSTYEPAAWNLNCYGTLPGEVHGAYYESDCHTYKNVGN